MNWPNAITIARVGLVPVFLVLGLRDAEGTSIAALVVFAVASASDSLDGYLARRSDTVSRLGKFLDPTADKLLVVAALVVLVDAREFPLWAALAIVAREVAVQILRTRIVSRGGDLPASPIAKLKTFLQVGLVSWWLWPFDDVNFMHWVWVAAVLAASYWSATEYFRQDARVKAAAS